MLSTFSIPQVVQVAQNFDNRLMNENFMTENNRD